MFLLLDKDREPIRELVDWISITASIRFSSPGQLNVTLYEKSDEAEMIEELMYILYVETSTLFLIDYIERNIEVNDAKAVIVKGITVEGFLDQRIVYEDKLLDGSNLQTYIHDLFKENIIEPVDVTRKVDFFSFIQSSDPKVTAATVKGLVSGISVMQAITSLLEVRNLGYKVTYDILTKMVSFTIIPGHNLCAGFTSILHGVNEDNTVTLSSESETLKDVKSIIDLTPYKTRVYVKNFDDLKIFNRGATESGMNLREAYLSTGHGEAFTGDTGGYDGPYLPPIPPITFPPTDFPGDVPIPKEPPKTGLVGLYVLTNKNRLLGCAFYPGDLVPEIWFDITPEPVDGVNVGLDTGSSAVTLENGDLILVGDGRKKVYRASMAGGWFGTRYFTQAEVILDASKVDVGDGPGGVSIRSSNRIGSLGVDIYTGRVSGTLINYELDSVTIYGIAHHAKVFDGTAYDLAVVSPLQKLDVGYPGLGLWPMRISGDFATYSGVWGLLSSKILIFDFLKKEWKVLSSGSDRDYSHAWHIRPVQDSDATYYTGAVVEPTGFLGRSKDGFGGAPVQSTWLTEWMQPWSTAWSLDGKSVFGQGMYSRYGLTTITEDPLSATTLLVNKPYESDGFCGLSFAGIDAATGNKKWGYMMQGRRTVDNWYWATPAYYVTSNQNLTGFVNITPELKTWLALLSPWGVVGDVLNEWPVHAWPILG